MKKSILLLFAVLLTMQVSAVKKGKRKRIKAKTTVAPTPIKKERDKANSMRLCSTPDPQPAWFLELPSKFTFPPKFQQPANYKLLSTIDSSFDSFLSTIPYENSPAKIMIPLFMNGVIECKEFNISRTVTMDSALQAKFPQLRSFKAFAPDNSLNAARIDTDEQSVKMMVTYDKKIYYVHSINYGGTRYYACYAKDDPNFAKDKFEK